jgi:hypothetical protein
LCHCGASFARRDLLTRHQRLAEHESDAPSPEPVQDRRAIAPSTNHATVGDQADLAAAVSLSGLSVSVDPWFCARTQQAMQLPVSPAAPSVVDQFQQQTNADPNQFVPNFLSPQMLDNGGSAS